ncbi:hypothetical protein GCM10027562_21990 [Arthrobacter pigmenti]
MAACDTCGNEYDKTFTVTRGSESGTFDSFECAIHAMAPACSHCGCRILGHGVEAEGSMYCCANCARETGHAGVTDRS